MEMTEPMKIYLEEIDLIPVLTKEDENKFTEMVRNGDMSGKDKLQERCLKLVVTIAYEFSEVNIPIMDLIQEGNIGLMMATASFDYNSGEEFSVYASIKIKEAMQEYIKEQGEDIKIPAKLAEKMQKVIDAKEALEKDGTHIASAGEVAAHLKDVSEEDTKRILELISNPEELKALAASGEDFFDDEEKEEDQEDKKEQDIVDEAVESLVRQEEVRELMSCLNEEEKSVIALKFGLGKEKAYTYDEIACELKIAEDEVHRLEECAMKKLRSSVTKN